MKFAILAAGEGSRLRNEGADVPKPLTEINGETLIDRLLRIFHENGSEETVVIVNELTGRVRRHITDNYNTVADTSRAVSRPEGGARVATVVRLLSKTTPSSMHSFYELSAFLGNGKFCLTTVDTVFNEAHFAEYIKAWRRSEADGLVAVTPYVDDESPLFVTVNGQMRVTGFHDSPESHSYVSGGIYCLAPTCLPTLERCVAGGQSRMRNFQRQMVADGLRVEAHVFDKILDVDHVGDIEKATEFLTRQ